MSSKTLMKPDSLTGNLQWKAPKVFARLASSKEHLKISTLWKQYCAHIATGDEVSTLSEEQLARNFLYMSGLFMSMMEYKQRKGNALAQVFTAIPKNATYISLEIQNKIIVLMSERVASEIVAEIRDGWYMLKVDRIKDRTGCKNMLTVLHYLDIDNETHKRLLVMSTTEHCDALCLTNLVLSEVGKAGLSTEMILSQCTENITGES